MTKTAAIKAIKQIPGMTAGPTPSREIRVRRIGSLNEEGYFTDDPEDALLSARAMALPVTKPPTLFQVIEMDDSFPVNVNPIGSPHLSRAQAEAEIRAIVRLDWGFEETDGTADYEGEGTLSFRAVSNDGTFTLAILPIEFASFVSAEKEAGL